MLPLWDTIRVVSSFYYDFIVRHAATGRARELGGGNHVRIVISFNDHANSAERLPSFLSHLSRFY